jgi:hypothetical protein
VLGSQMGRVVLGSQMGRCAGLSDGALCWALRWGAVLGSQMGRSRRWPKASAPGEEPVKTYGLCPYSRVY